jgi:hypothetical protein
LGIREGAENMAPRKSHSTKSKKHGFTHHLWIADENGNLFFVKRDKGSNRLVGHKVAGAKSRFDFDSKDELTARKLVRKENGKHERSVAVVKMLLAMGVTSAAIPKDIIDPGNDSVIEATSYVINLASFDVENIFWPEVNVTPKISLVPHRNKK